MRNDFFKQKSFSDTEQNYILSENNSFSYQTGHNLVTGGRGSAKR